MSDYIYYTGKTQFSKDAQIDCIGRPLISEDGKTVGYITKAEWDGECYVITFELSDIEYAKDLAEKLTIG